ncbi:MAG TPA: DNA-processing protein DprA [Candidatus Binatia bacterium]|jgi:predicted Rossmann fold nucleotide-binding protein DprA/Smf involved in DNA uptake
MTNTWEILEVTPPTGVEAFLRGKPSKLWGVGDPAILNYRLLGIISARQVDSDLALETARLLKQLVSLEDAAFVSGWHSPLEEEALQILLAQEATVVLCVAKSLDRFIPSMGVESRVTDGKALLLTHCSTKAKRITRNASMRRNELIVELVKALLVLSAPEGSASLSLAKSALRRGKFVLTPEHPMNKELLASGALPATLDNLQTALR